MSEELKERMRIFALGVIRLVAICRMTKWEMCLAGNC